MVVVGGSIPLVPTKNLLLKRRLNGAYYIAGWKPKKFTDRLPLWRVAESIGAGLAKAALAAEVDEKLVDLSYEIPHDASLKIITGKDPAGLEVIRHSTAHLLAQAVKALFPEAQVTIGPVIEDGFYYDFAFDYHFSPDDFAAIEEKMQELVKADLTVHRKVS